MTIFDDLNKEKLAEVFAHIRLRQRTMLSDSILVRQNDSCEKIFYVINGTIEAYKKIGDKEIFVKGITTGEYIGINLIFSSNPLYRATFKAKDKVSVEEINKEDLIKVLQYDERILKKFLNILTDLAIEQNDSMKIKTMKTIRTKLCYFLYEEYKKNNSLEFELNYSKTDLARLLNVERPSVGYEIKKLVDDKIIENKNKHYKIISLTDLMNNLK